MRTSCEDVTEAVIRGGKQAICARPVVWLQPQCRGVERRQVETRHRFPMRGDLAQLLCSASKIDATILQARLQQDGLHIYFYSSTVRGFAGRGNSFAQGGPQHAIGISGRLNP